LKKPKVFVTREIPDRGLRIIKEHFEAEVWQDYAPPRKQVIIQKAAEVDALAPLLSDEIDSEVFDAAPNLKIVAQLAVGYDNIDVKEATKRGIYVTNTPEVLTETTADFAWTLLITVARRVVEADKYVRSGKWKVGWHPSMLLGRDVYGATIGIVGLGRIGLAVAKRARGFNMKILYYDVIRNKQLEREMGLEHTTLDILLQKSDFVSVHVPLTEATYHLIDEEKLQLMKKTAYLINNSRGAVIDEKALYMALKSKQIAGAGLDVFEQEPISTDNPLLNLDNVVVTPHISSASYETRSKMAEMVAENLVSFFEGKVPPNLVNQQVVEVRKPSGKAHMDKQSVRNTKRQKY
jgi:glyoxylate reductase